MSFIKKHAIAIILISLVIGIAYLSYYNYKVQKSLLLQRMQENSLNIASSVSSAMDRFEDIKSTMSLEKLVDDISFKLEIFEFRYIDPDGSIRNSMFKEEIGKTLTSKRFIETMQGDKRLNTFFFEIRDYVEVMSIYYPIYTSNQLIGIIDLSVDISEYDLKEGVKNNPALLHRQVDIQNLLKSISASVTNSLAILMKTNINDFLQAYVASTKTITQISVIDEEKNIYISSDISLIGKNLKNNYNKDSGITMVNSKPTYVTLVNSNLHNKNEKTNLRLLIDASTYVKHENQLLNTAIITSFIALFSALLTSGLIYFTAIEQSRKEKERLEHLVEIRTKEIEVLSKTDSLTNLWNRRYLEENLALEFKRAKRYKHDLSVMIIDLDHFKNINDTYGHLAGDEVLRQISSRIKESQRETDFIGRYGGEEIVVILPETNLEASIKIANLILKVISAKPVEFESNSIVVTTSIGVSSIKEEHSEYSMIFAEADEALYSAKELGRNRVEVFEIKSV